MAEVIWSALLRPPYHLDFISEQEAFQGNKKLPKPPDNQDEIA